jgi:hypothetical protein
MYTKLSRASSLVVGVLLAALSACTVDNPSFEEPPDPSATATTPSNSTAPAGCPGVNQLIAESIAAGLVPTTVRTLRDQVDKLDLQIANLTFQLVASKCATFSITAASPEFTCIGGSDGKTQYQGHFQSFPDPTGGTTCLMQFTETGGRPEFTCRQVGILDGVKVFTCPYNWMNPDPRVPEWKCSTP